MSDTTNRGTKSEIVLIGLLLAVLLISCVLLLIQLPALSQSTPQAALEAGSRATIETAARTADTAITAAQTAEAKTGVLETQLKTVAETATTALVRADAAITMTETIQAGLEPTTTLTSALASLSIDGGVALTYQTAGQSQGKAFYRVDCLFVYRNYNDFQQELPNDCVTEQATIQLALVETEPDSNQSHLFYDQAGLPATDLEAEFSRWSEYELVAEMSPVQGDDQANTSSTKLTLYETLPQMIVAATGVVTSADLAESLVNLETAKEPFGLSNGLIDKLLLVDRINGQTTYTLVVLYPDSPAGGDRRGFWCRAICRWFRGCRWICR